MFTRASLRPRSRRPARRPGSTAVLGLRAHGRFPLRHGNAVMSTRQCVTACRIELGAQKTTFQLAAYQGSHPPGGQGRPDHVQPRGAARIEFCSGSVPSAQNWVHKLLTRHSDAEVPARRSGLLGVSISPRCAATRRRRREPKPITADRRRGPNLRPTDARRIAANIAKLPDSSPAGLRPVKLETLLPRGAFRCVPPRKDLKPCCVRSGEPCTYLAAQPQR